jgi:hypothetical protein
VENIIRKKLDKKKNSKFLVDKNNFTIKIFKNIKIKYTSVKLISGLKIKLNI